MTLLILLAALLVQDTPFPNVDPEPAIKAARKKATENNRVVLVLWGANDSDKSRAAVTMLKKDKEVAKLILYEYDLVLADKRHFLTHRGGLVEFPRVVVMGADGKALSESPPPTDAKEWTTLLEKHKSTPLLAKDVLAAGLKKAGAEKKRVLLTFGAPW